MAPKKYKIIGFSKDDSFFNHAIGTKLIGLTGHIGHMMYKIDHYGNEVYSGDFILDQISVVKLLTNATIIPFFRMTKDEYGDIEYNILNFYEVYLKEVDQYPFINEN